MPASVSKRNTIPIVLQILFTYLVIVHGFNPYAGSVAMRDMCFYIFLLNNTYVVTYYDFRIHLPNTTCQLLLLIYPICKLYIFTIMRGPSSRMALL